MTLGSFLGGLRGTTFLAAKITPMDHRQGLLANLTTSSIVLMTGGRWPPSVNDPRGLLRACSTIGAPSNDTCSGYGPRLDHSPLSCRIFSITCRSEDFQYKLTGRRLSHHVPCLGQGAWWPRQGWGKYFVNSHGEASACRGTLREPLDA